uniref:Uncharacterized protein n=1 Tax=Chromera velia CCMP2878 TaxID=1169474 RepID=A0A0G4IA95_9ALVE|eukprot:Cvel_12403.t1-p1 / transcript=Cvel_12403.t1 / gene=Cvel_12403 / organism=Chromera_velia_CCMP2878 / gene_product=hypothetical protein / transcript_product=hypothetical protein / location=Cvel_scaffold810:57464-58882(-) / protein_length=285 / sequence_SO=supercontig / SO=protein_coding / is_pseudo=false
MVVLETVLLLETVRDRFVLGGKLFTFPVVKKKAHLIQLLAEAAAEAAAAAERERLQAEEERAAAAAAADSGVVGGRQDVASLRQLSRGAEQPRNMYEDDDGRDMDNPDGGQTGEGGANQAGSRRRGGRGGGPPPGVRGPPGGQGGNAIKSGLAAGQGAPKRGTGRGGGSRGGRGRGRAKGKKRVPDTYVEDDFLVMDSGGQDYTMTGDYDDAADEDYIPPEAQYSKKTLKRNFTVRSNPEEPKIQRGQCTIDKLDGVRTTKGGHQIVPGMAALSLPGAPQMRAGF